ncbi:MAG: hypothetical protein LUD02_04935 [Tannerellaceae bacterium]|nr:hypothetical protein [Tannerellaceae bacterium]MCD8263572.1 hypothetical protein [Tannerellaceae bacterium]
MEEQLRQLYQRIEYLRSQGVKMKEIADWADMAPSVVSSLYTTVLPAYFKGLKTFPPEEALDNALLLVNNISKRKLVNNTPVMISRLHQLEPDELDIPKEQTFIDRLQQDLRQSAGRIPEIEGTYINYSLSSSSASLKVEPYIICMNERKDHLRIGRLSACHEIQWGVALAGNHQSVYGMFSEHSEPKLTLVTVYLQLPMFDRPRQLRGLYIGLDYNHNPVARRILFVKQSNDTDVTEFTQMESDLIAPGALTEEQQAYYDYTCQPGDFIKMCTVPSLQMDASDLVKEKKMLAL